MQITEVRVKLMEDPHERLMAFCSVTIDGCFVIRDLKLIQGKGGPFVAMPSRKLTDRCPRCHTKNHLRAAYCNHCGVRLKDERAAKDDDGRAKLYADIAHPINPACRELIQAEIARAYERELVLSKQPGYICSYDDYGEDRYADLDEFEFASETFEARGRAHRVDPTHALADPHEAERIREPQTTRRNGDEEFGSGLI
jgi:stage V sporulation protein G